MQDASYKQQTKQKYKPSHQQAKLLPHITLLFITSKQTKNSEKISPYTKVTQTTGPILGGQKPKGRNNSTFFKERIQISLKPGKETSNTITLKTNEKAEKYWKNEETKVQISEEEIGKLPEKDFRIMIVKIKNLENKVEKMQ